MTIARNNEAFNRAQAHYDAMEPPDPGCSHEEWEAPYRDRITSSTQDIEIECAQCLISGTLDFNDSETISINWDE